jgi:hypothetical protein
VRVGAEAKEVTCVGVKAKGRLGLPDASPPPREMSGEPSSGGEGEKAAALGLGRRLRACLNTESPNAVAAAVALAASTFARGMYEKLAGADEACGGRGFWEAEEEAEEAAEGTAAAEGLGEMLVEPTFGMDVACFRWRWR